MLKTAKKAAKMGGRILKKEFRKLKKTQIDIKGKGDYVTDVLFVDTSGSNNISTASTAGLGRDVYFNIPVSAGGAAGNELAWRFRFDGSNLAGLNAETDGAGTFREPVFQIPYYSGDYGAGWVAAPNPTPAGLEDGSMFIAHNTNGAGDDRLFARSNSVWRSVQIT